MLCEYTFVPRDAGDAGRRELEDWAGALLARLRNNGQLWGRAVVGWVDGTLRATFHVPTADALDDVHASRGVAGTAKQVRALCAEPPAWRIVGDETDTDAGDATGAPALVLKADVFRETSPVREGRAGTPVPLFRLPIGWDVRENLVVWMRRAQLHEELWIQSGRLESAAYRELSEPDSALATEGRELARAVEDVTGIATYYFLRHFWGRRVEDARDVCPACRAPWATESLGSTPAGIDGFTYRCDPCRLVSEAATATRAEPADA